MALKDECQLILWMEGLKEFQEEIQYIQRHRIKYEFDLVRMSSIVENIFWRRGRDKVAEREKFM